MHIIWSLNMSRDIKLISQLNIVEYFFHLYLSDWQIWNEFKQIQKQSLTAKCLELVQEPLKICSFVYHKTTSHK
jgi:hypothetical protein